MHTRACIYICTCVRAHAYGEKWLDIHRGDRSFNPSGDGINQCISLHYGALSNRLLQCPLDVNVRYCPKPVSCAAESYFGVMWCGGMWCVCVVCGVWCVRVVCGGVCVVCGV